MSSPALINAIMLTVALVGSTNFVLSPLLADIAADLGIAIARSVLVPATCAGALAVVAPVVGLGMQTFRRSTVLVGGLLVYGAAWGGASLAPRFDLLLVCAALAGAAVGAVLPACYAAAAEMSGERDRARVMGRIVGGWAIAFLSVLPFTFLAQWTGWRGALALLGGAALLLAAVVTMVRRPGPGSAGNAVAPQADSHAAREQTDLALILRSIREVFGDRPTVALLGVNLIDMAAFFGVYAYLGSEIRRVTGWGVSATGAVMAAYGIGLAIITFNGHWIDRFGRQRSAVLALAALAPILSLLPWSLHQPWAIALNVGAWGLVQGSVFTAMTALATEQLPQRRAVVTALLSCSTYLGISLLTPAFVAVFERAGYRVLAAACGAACLLSGLWLSRVALRGAVPARS
ncbi:MAG TPA: MFS transporter [Burkholderiaceae bacterium]|nr:MFS transporter [Burkholderiaceae bacterium]